MEREVNGRIYFMEKFIISGGKQLNGTVSVSGAKNVALKALVAATLTDEEIVIENIPLISDFFVMVEIIKELGGEVTITDHQARVQMKEFSKDTISLDEASHIRTSSMFLAPMLVRLKKAIIPNPGGCRLGARPIDRIVDGVAQMGAAIEYDSDDGYFHATADKLHGISYTFTKNTHTGTETMIIAAVLAEGKTILENAAAEPEIDELINLLNSMGAKIRRVSERRIEIEGVEKLHGTTFTISPDRNEVVTFAIAAYITGGEVLVKGAREKDVQAFLEKLTQAGAKFSIEAEGIRFTTNGTLKATDVTTLPHPGFMTDWQAPWTVLMTQADGVSTVHETVFENKLTYIADLKKMGADIKPFKPEIADPETFYNFNLDDDKPEYVHAVRITGPKKLHNAVVSMVDLRAGAAVVMAALAAKGITNIHNINLIDRGYEKFEERLSALGADIRRVSE